MGLQCSSLLSLVPNHRVPPSDFLCVPYAQRPQTPGSWEDNSHTHKSLSQHPTHGRLSPTDLEEQCLLHYAPGRKSSSRVTYLANTSVPLSALLVLLRIFHIWYRTPNQQSMEKLSLTCSHMHSTHLIFYPSETKLFLKDEITIIAPSVLSHLRGATIRRQFYCQITKSMVCQLPLNFSALCRYRLMDLYTGWQNTGQEFSECRLKDMAS